jgi:hypothetical protein
LAPVIEFTQAGTCYQKEKKSDSAKFECDEVFTILGFSGSLLRNILLCVMSAETWDILFCLNFLW